MSDLKFLKPGQLGHGVMVEYDAGYISPNDARNQAFINEVKKLHEGKGIVPEKLEVVVVLQKYDVENRNGRVYPRKVLERENDNYQQLIKERRAIGEADHPESSIVAVDRISHNITETWWDGKTLMGKMEIIMSPAFISQGIISCQGDNVANLLRQGIMIGVSSRGVGSLKQVGGKNVVQEDFELICWDIVTSPSTPGSWIFNKEQEAKPFVESEKKNGNVLSDKLDKFLLEEGTRIEEKTTKSTYSINDKLDNFLDDLTI